MRTTHIIGLIGVGTLLVVLPLAAKDKGGKGDRDDQPAPPPPGPAVVHARTVPAPQTKPAPPGPEPWVGVKVSISGDERRIIQGYADHPPTAGPHHGKKGKDLPPGLSKKVARGGELPPGWQKRCVPGQIMPPEVYRQCQPLPPELVVKLPPPPPGTITVTIGGKVARLAKATLEILDVFDVRL